MIFICRIFYISIRYLSRYNNPFNALCLFADLTFLDKSLAYISFKIFLNGAISLLSINVSTPSLTAIYLTLCKGKYCSV